MTLVERVAVIGGTGEEGSGLALRWARAGIDVVIGSRDAERAEKAAAEFSSQVPDGSFSGMANADAAAACEAVVVTVPFSGQAMIYKSIAASIREGAVVVDCTVPVAASIGGKPTQVLGVWEGSAAQHAASFLPKGTQLCAAFHSLSGSALHDLDSALEGDVLVCGPKAAKPVVETLVRSIPDLGYVDAGGLSSARIVESITALLIGINHRYGTDRSGVRITGLP